MGPYQFSERSLRRLYTCHRFIRLTLFEVIRFYDLSILEGIRSIERQQELYHQGRSKLDGIVKKSKHQGHIVDEEFAGIDYSTGEILRDDKGNPIASLACDIMPYKQGTNAFSGDPKDNARFYHMQGIVRGVFEELKNRGKVDGELRFGIDWDRDDIYTDQTFDDLPHFELII